MSPRVRAIVATRVNNFDSKKNLIPLAKQIASQNREHQIGGLICYGNGSFLQLIEGERLEISRALIRIGRVAPDTTEFLGLREVREDDIKFEEWLEEPFIIENTFAIFSRESFAPNTFSFLVAEALITSLFKNNHTDKKCI
jgi:hypothetical protein